MSVRSFCGGRLSGRLLAEIVGLEYDTVKKYWSKRLKLEGKGRHAKDVSPEEICQFIEERYRQRIANENKHDVDYIRSLLDLDRDGDIDFRLPA